MNVFIETLNQWGSGFLSFFWPMLWQASLLIVILFGVDYWSRRHVRASVRYTLWLVVLVKLCLPPTLALPTSPVWWLHKTHFVMAPAVTHHYSVTYDQETPPETLAKPVPDLGQRSSMTMGAGMLVASVIISTTLLLWLLVRWAQVTRRVRRAGDSERLNGLLQQSQILAGLSFSVQAKVTGNSMSPAVCGLFKPVILIPNSLVNTFSDEQLRAVLLHELIHLRRRDVWVNFLQALLQIVYWWHPLVWLANGRIRSVREEAVDDAVVLALRDDAENYAPTLLAVAKLALRRPMVSLGLVGIMESRHALRQRIERLLETRTPRRTGLTLASLLGVLAFTAVAVPMGAAPDTASDSFPANRPAGQAVLVTAQFYAISPWEMNPDNDDALIHPANPATYPITHSDGQKYVMIFTPQERAAWEAKYKTWGLQPFWRATVKTRDGEGALISTGTNASALKFICRPHIGDQGITLAFNTEIPGNAAGNDKLIFPVKLADTLRTEDGGGFFLETKPRPPDKYRLVVMIGIKLVTNSPPAKTSQGSSAVNSGSASLTQSPADRRVRMEMAQKPARPQLHLKAWFMEVPKGTWDSLEKFPVTTTNEDQAMVGILTSQQQKTVMQNLRRDSTVYNYAEPEATTTSGRQTQMRATSLVTVITNVASDDKVTNGSISLVYETGTLETGPILDATAKVLPDGYTIDIKTSPSFTDFLGYDHPPTNTPDKFLPDAPYPLPTVLPSWHVQRASAHVRLWDGQTVAFGKIEEHRFSGGKEIAGPAGKKDTELLVLVTVWVVDPAGNRVHADDQMPFALNGIPEQTGD